MKRWRRIRESPLVTRLLPDDPNSLKEGVDDSQKFHREPLEEDSPYPEVRAAVPNWDDPDIPQNTIRVWVLGLVSITVCGILNVMLAFQTNAYAVGPHIVTIGVWPIGKLWELVVPKRRIFGVDLNPGPFNIKEHALITIMASCALGDGPSYATEYVATTRYLMNESMSWGFIVLLVLSTQLVGLAMAGMVKRVLVYPSAFIFPNSLVEVTLIGNLHIKSNYVANGWRISRVKLLLILIVAGSIYQWLPTFLAQFLSQFAWAGWVAPDNVVVNQLFGVQSGIALLPLCFDWSSIAGYLGSPLVPPLGTLVNMLLMLIIFFWVVSPILNFCNVWYGDYLPLISPSSSLFDRYQNTYQVSKVLDNGQFSQERYAAYSPMFIPGSSVIAYALSLAGVTATFVHAAVFDLPSIIKYWKTSSQATGDLHMRLMRHYPEVHFLVYFGIFIGCFVMMVVISSVYSHLGVHMMVLALAIAVIMFIPAGFLYATTNISLGLNVISELIQGYISPGSASSNMLFKIFCYYPHLMGLSFLENMKVGHYLKISPRAMILVQIFGAVWGGLLQVLVLSWLKTHFDDFCSDDQRQGFTCPLPRTFFASAQIWGTIGSMRVLEMYKPVLYFLILGAALPVLSWTWLRRNPTSVLRHIHWPVFFNSAALIPPATPYNYLTYLQAGFLFTYYVRGRYFNWWAKYNYTVSAGLELAVIVGTLIIILVSLNGNVNRPSWWGNVGAFDNVDMDNVPRKVLAPGEWFGPSTW